MKQAREIENSYCLVSMGSETELTPIANSRSLMFCLVQFERKKCVIISHVGFSNARRGWDFVLFWLRGFDFKRRLKSL